MTNPMPYEAHASYYPSEVDRELIFQQSQQQQHDWSGYTEARTIETGHTIG
jgi:hypothetical protein